MAVDIGKFLAVGIKIAGFIPVAINAVEAIKGKSGAEKRQAVLDAITSGVPAVEALVGKDLLEDPKVVEAAGNYIDAYVALQKAIRLSTQLRPQPTVE